MNQEDRLIFICTDFQDSPWSQNTGSFVIDVQSVNQQPVAAVKATPASATSAPITNSMVSQVPKTNSGDSGYYLAVIIFPVIVLCVGGVYGLHRIRKKHSVMSRIRIRNAYPGALHQTRMQTLPQNSVYHRLKMNQTIMIFLSAIHLKINRRRCDM